MFCFWLSPEKLIFKVILIITESNKSLYKNYFLEGKKQTTCKQEILFLLEYKHLLCRCFLNALSNKQTKHIHPRNFNLPQMQPPSTSVKPIDISEISLLLSSWNPPRTFHSVWNTKGPLETLQLSKPLLRIYSCFFRERLKRSDIN